MSPLTVTIVVVAAAILIGVYVSWRAGRLDRLHTRVETARASLEAALLRRSAVALELAACGLLDPATSLLLAGGAPLPEFFEIDDSVVTGGAEGSGADMLHFTSGGDDTPGQVA